MQTTKEMAKEFAAFSREIAHQQPKCSVIQVGIGKAVLQGVMLALLAVAASTGSGNAQARGGPWAIGD